MKKVMLCVLALMGVMSNDVMAYDASDIVFKDDGIRDFCLRNKIDTNKDGNISLDEATAVTNGLQGHAS
jgi:hypothetical protein